MSDKAFDAGVRREAGMVVIDMSGTIDGNAEGELDAAYDATESDAGALGLGFEGVDYINSTGIALLVRLLAKARERDRPVRAWGLSDHYREIFELTRLADFLELFADESSALSGRG
jgi:anti-anti-sigma factor